MYEIERKQITPIAKFIYASTAIMAMYLVVELLEIFSLI